MNDSRRLKIVVVNSLVAPDGADDAEIEQADRARALRIGLLENGYNILAALPPGDDLEAQIAKLQPDLIIVDDIGLLPVSEDAAEGFYRLVDAAYERRAIAVSSNLHPSGFDEIMPKTLATATVDRLLHHAHAAAARSRRRAGIPWHGGRGAPPIAPRRPTTCCATRVCPTLTPHRTCT